MTRAFGAVCLAACTPAVLLGQWQSLNGGVDWQVRALELNSDSTQLIIAGPFIWTNDSVRANGVVKWDGNSWSTSGCGNGDGDTTALGVGGPFIISLAEHLDTLYAGMVGTGWQYDLDWRNCAFLYNDQWHRCGDPENWFFVNDVAGRLFSYGRADTLYGQYMPNVREWIGGQWRLLPHSPFDEWSEVYASCEWQGDLYFGGLFNELGCRKVLRFDGDSTWTPLGAGVGGNFIRAMAGFGDSLYVGGFFQPGPDVQSTHVQIWDGNSWLPFFPEVTYYGTVMDMQVYEGALYIAGIFHFTGESTWYNLLRYDGHQLCAIGGPTPSGDNGEIEFFQGDLYMALGGTFAALPGEFIGRLPLAGLVPDTCITVAPSAVPELQISSFTIAPHPVQDILQLHGPEQLLRESELVIHDARGRVVLRDQLDGSNQVNVARLGPGLYVAVLAADDDIPRMAQRFVKN